MPDAVPTFAAIVDRFLDQNARAAAVRDFPAHGVAFLTFLRDHVHPGHVFGDMVAFIPQGASAACDEPGDGDHGEEADAPCPECARRSAERFRRLGEEFAARQQEALLDQLTRNNGDDDQGDDVTVDHTTREGLVQELADALRDGDRAALIVSGEQLAILIEALDNVPTCRTRLRSAVADLLPGLRKLFAAAFVPDSGG